MGDDVVVKHVAFELELVKTVLHDVADADDAGKLAVLDHRQMPDALHRHEPHRLLHACLRGAGKRMSSHEFGDRLVEHLGAVVDEPIDDIAFGNDSFDQASVAADNERPDTLKPKPSCCHAYQGRRLDGYDFGTLAFKNLLYRHHRQLR